MKRLPTVSCTLFTFSFLQYANQGLNRASEKFNLTIVYAEKVLATDPLL